MKRCDLSQTLLIRGRAASVSLLVALFAMLLSPSISVRADVIQDNVETSGNITLVTANGVPVNIGYRIQANSGDGQSGCNASDGTPAKLTLSGLPAGAVVGPIPLTISQCVSSFSTITISIPHFVAPGDYPIVPVINDSGTGSYNTSPAASTLRVVAPANSPPSVSVIGVTDGATYEIGAVPAAGCSVVDAEDAGESATPVINGTLTNGLGSETATCSYTDGGGLKASAAARYSIVDTGAPLLDCTVPDNSVWYGANQTVNCTAGDGGSGLANPADASFSLGTTVADGTDDAAATTGSKSVCDNGGNCVTAGPYTFMIDLAAPTISSTRTFTSNDTTYPGDWTHDKVTVTFYCNDNGGSGGSTTEYLESHTPVTTNGQAFNDTITSDNVCTDPIGNSSAQGVSDLVQVDKQDPVISPGNVTDTTWRNTSLSQDFAASDEDSGLADPGDASFTLTASAESTLNGDGASVPTSVSKTVHDAVGNSTTRTLSALIDLTDPSITASAKTADGQPYVSGTWTNQTVTVSFQCADALSGIETGTCPDDIEVSAETSVDGQNVSNSVSDRAGNSAESSVIVVMVDKTAPTITASAKTADGNPYAGGWTNQTVTVHFECSESLSGLAGACPADVEVASDTLAAGQSVSGSISDNAGNSASTDPIVVKVDKSAPRIALQSVKKADNSTYVPGAGNWSNQDVTVTWACSDGLSGTATSSVDDTKGEGVGQTASGTCFDNAGNSASASVSNINVDKTVPFNVTFVGGPAAGGTYYFGSVPAAPTCTAEDALSGVASCTVTGHGSTVGTHTMTATAVDNAGNRETSSRSYSVLAWTARGFYSPVDMNGVVNTVKAGSTVPLKFEVFAGSTELTDVAIVSEIKVSKITVPTATPTDEIEITATGGTSLRYDSIGGQFIYNWSTKGLTAGQCYQITLKLQDGSTIVAYFKMR